MPHEGLAPFNEYTLDNRSNLGEYAAGMGGTLLSFAGILLILQTIGDQLREMKEMRLMHEEQQFETSFIRRSTDTTSSHLLAPLQSPTEKQFPISRKHRLLRRSVCRGHGAARPAARRSCRDFACTAGKAEYSCAAHMPTTKSRRKPIIFIATGVVLVTIIMIVILKKREPAIVVQTDKVTRRNITETVVANGRIQPVVQVKISPEVSGEIIELPVKEGQSVNKGDLLVKIKPDIYIASRNQVDAAYKSSLAGRATAEANLRKAEADFKRSRGLFESKLIPESDFDQARASFDVATAQLNSADHQVEMAKASLANAEEELAKTTILSPVTGVITKLNSQLGERVLGTVQNVGTDIMTISDLSQMEARVDVGEIDVVLIRPSQKAKLEVDAFKDRKFVGTVTDIANSSKGAGSLTSSSSSQEATKFEVRIRINETEAFRPGMSVTAEIETRYRTNSLAVPMASVTTRGPKNPVGTNAVTGVEKKSKDTAKPAEIVFVVNGNHVKATPVKIGICDDNYWEITEGLTEGQEIVSGGYRAISRDLEDGKKIKKGTASDEAPKK
jgi:HlyD family secretion protein